MFSCLLLWLILSYLMLLHISCHVLCQVQCHVSCYIMCHVTSWLMFYVMPYLFFYFMTHVLSYGMPWLLTLKVAVVPLLLIWMHFNYCSCWSDGHRSNQAKARSHRLPSAARWSLASIPGTMRVWGISHVQIVNISPACPLNALFTLRLSCKPHGLSETVLDKLIL